MDLGRWNVANFVFGFERRLGNTRRDRHVLWDRGMYVTLG